MTDAVADEQATQLLSILRNIPADERKTHREFVLRHINFLTEILTGELSIRQWTHPCGCPTATPASRAHKRKSGEKFPCEYGRLTNHGASDGTDTIGDCACGDPLAESNDPLDAVAATVLASNDQPVAARYFDTEWRALVARLREKLGPWAAIADLSRPELHEVLGTLTDRPGIETNRVARLSKLLENLHNHRWIDTVSLRHLPPVPYSNLAEFLENQPGILESDGWWLVLTAFDKPVWPADEHIDRLLCDLGLLTPVDLKTETVRRRGIEEVLTDRQIPKLHRALGGFAARGVSVFCAEEFEVRKFSLSYRTGEQRIHRKGPVIVDLFAGAGGLSHGFSRAGYNMALAIDNDKHASDTYRLNHPEVPHKRVLCEDVSNVLDDGTLDSLQRPVDIVVGGPPCQALSQAGYRARLANDEDYSILEDPRTELYREYVEVIDRLRPDALVLENVEGMISEVADTDIRAVDHITEALEHVGYTCVSEVVDCSEFGIPQTRDRVVILGIHDSYTFGNKDVKRLFETLADTAPDGRYTLKDGLSNLPLLRRGKGGNVVTGKRAGRPSSYVSSNNLARGTQLTFNHKAREHPMAKDRELFDEVMEPGDTGWMVKYEKGRDDLIEYNVGTKEDPEFRDKYRMLHWDEPAPTVVAHLAKDANNFIIPDYHEYAVPDESKTNKQRNRGVTPREAARLQSFPDDYIFLGPFTSQFRQIGNAVPPLLGEQIARVLCDELRPVGEATVAAGQAAYHPAASSADD